MKDLYQKILDKPESYRQRLAYIITALLGVVIFTIWLSQTMISMKKTFSSSEDKNQAVENIKKTMPSLQTDSLKMPENILPTTQIPSEQTPPATDNGVTDTTITNPNVQDGVGTFNIKGLKMKTPEESAGTAGTSEDGAMLKPVEN